MHLFTATDENYYHHACALLASYRQCHPEGLAFVYGVGLEGRRRAELEAFGAQLIEDGPPKSVSSASYVTCRRFVALRRALPLLTDQAAVLYDADTIIRRPLSPIADQLGNGDVAGRLRPGTNQDRKIYGGVLAVRNTRGANSFLLSYERHLRSRGIAWYADQWSLFQAYRDTRDNGLTRFVDLQPIVMNRRLHKRALAWSPSPTWRKHPRFRAESESFQQQFAETVQRRLSAAGKPS